MMRKILLITLSLLLMACAVQAKKKKGKSGPPKWLDNPQAVYAPSQFLSALGEGDSRSEAEAMASGNLAKIFEQTVTADETFMQRYDELTQGSNSSVSMENSVIKNVNVQAGQTLMNIQFGESYTDNMGRVHVIGYLDRLKTGELYEGRINDNAAQIAFFYKKATSSQDAIERYSAMNAAASFVVATDVLLKQLDIISPTSKEFLELGYNGNEIKQQAAELARDISFSINISGDDEGKVAIAVKELMTDYGFVVAPKGLLSTSGTIVMEETDLKRNNVVFVRYDLQLLLKDASGKTIVALDETGREGHTSFTEAKARAYKYLTKKIKKKFKSKLDAYFTGYMQRVSQ
ncbi:MAG: hypothetical protein J7K89_00230 [Candidatus Cloacimonetes bacterium]|nr:hypothetical protein [Candidatus Cloacimonadota bacterium]